MNIGAFATASFMWPARSVSAQLALELQLDVVPAALAK
jgi:hypothetical protein